MSEHIYMPVFNSEKEFNAYFSENIKAIEPYRNKEGVPSLKTQNEFEDMMSKLGFESTKDLIQFTIKL